MSANVIFCICTDQTTSNPVDPELVKELAKKVIPTLPKNNYLRVHKNKFKELCQFMETQHGIILTIKEAS